MARNADDLLADLDQLGSEEQVPRAAKKGSNKSAAPVTNNNNEDDPLADLEAQLAAKPAQASRPGTPRASSSTTSNTTKSPKRAEHTPASSGPPSGRNSEEQGRRGVAAGRTSGEARSYHQGTSASSKAQAASEPRAEASASGDGGGWWGSMFSAATAAVKQAETLAKEISGNEEVQRWADQARGNFSNLQHFGTDLRSRALPTFTSLISHIAPPISAHERLQIHITHDIQNYPSLDPLIYSTFSRVMAQVEGGDLMVIQKGSESRNRSSTEVGYRGGVLGGGNGWTDGPWWRDDTAKRSLGSVPGLKEGSKLARVSAEAYAKEFFDARGGVERAAEKATETLSETNPVRSSDIFLSIQAISHTAAQELFAVDAQSQQQTDGKTEDPAVVVEDLVTFAIYLYDPIHSLSFSTLSQAFPERWASWLDASPAAGESLPETINEIISSGGVDPREWVSEWIEEVIGLSVGIVAQNYVARRMGVGEGGIGRGKRRVEEEAAAGEAARAI